MSDSCDGSEKEVENTPPLDCVNLGGAASPCTGQDAEQQQSDGANEDKLQISNTCTHEDPNMRPKGHQLLKEKEMESDLSNSHASKPQTLTVTVINESMTADEDVPAEMKEQKTQQFESLEAASGKAPDSQDITVIEEQSQATQTVIEIENKDDKISPVQCTTEDQEQIQDIYEELLKAATITKEEDEQRNNLKVEDNLESGKKCRQCRQCDCDSLLQAVNCNFRVIGSKLFCFCLRHRRRQRQVVPAPVPAPVPGTYPIAVEQQGVVTVRAEGATELTAEQQELAIAEEHEKTRAYSLADIITPVIQRARDQGWWIYGKFAFPMVNDVVRDFWVLTELLLLLFAFVISLVFFAIDPDNRNGFNIFHLVLTTIASILAFLDALIQLKDFKSCKATLNCYRKVKAARQNELNVEDFTDQGNDNDSINSSEATGEETPTTKCQACVEKFKNVMDIVRTLASEAVFYPLLICDLFVFITCRGYEVSNHSDRLSLVLFLLSCLGIFLYVYLARVLVLCSVLISVHKKRTSMRKNRKDPTGLHVQIYFAVHVFVQMVAQIFMVITIGAKISYENRNYDPTSPLCESASPPDGICSPSASPRLWYMFVAGYIIPVCGILTFYIVCYYWITELPVTVCLDFLRMLKSGSCDNFVKSVKSTKDARKTSKRLLEHYYDSVSSSFKEIHNETFIFKVLFPFVNPLVVVLCITYAALHFAFFVCAGLPESVSQILATSDLVPLLSDGQGWTIFFSIAAATGALANLYVFLIAYFWIIVITVIITIIAVFILLLLLNLLNALCEFFES